MRSFISILTLFILASACRTGSNADMQFANSSDNSTYVLKMKPTSGSTYRYNIKNETEMKMEVEDKNINNITKSRVAVNYQMNKDSLGNLNLHIHYVKIHVYTKNGEIETDADAANTSYSVNAMDRMLGFLKEATMEATISPSGEVKSMKGFHELGARVISQMSDVDTYTRNIAQTQWDKVIGEGLVKKNIKDLFAFLPDSVIQVGDRWKTKSKQNTEIPLDVTTTFYFKEINDGLAVLEVDADMASGQGPIDYVGTEVTADLKGEQEGEYRMDLKTGMLRSCEIHSKVKGQIQAMGRDIPVTITTKTTINKSE